MSDSDLNTLPTVKQREGGEKVQRGERDGEERRFKKSVRGQRASEEVQGEETELEVKQAQDEEGRRRKPFFHLACECQ